MTADSRDDIEAKSKELEDKSGIQPVVDGIISVLHGDLGEMAAEGGAACRRHSYWRSGRALYVSLYCHPSRCCRLAKCPFGPLCRPPRPTGFCAGRPLVEFFQLEQQQLFKQQFVR